VITSENVRSFSVAADAPWAYQNDALPTSASSVRKKTPVYLSPLTAQFAFCPLGLPESLSRTDRGGASKQPSASPAAATAKQSF